MVAHPSDPHVAAMCCLLLRRVAWAWAHVGEDGTAAEQEAAMTAAASVLDAQPNVEAALGVHGVRSATVAEHGLWFLAHAVKSPPGGQADRCLLTVPPCALAALDAHRGLSAVAKGGLRLLASVAESGAHSAPLMEVLPLALAALNTHVCEVRVARDGLRLLKCLALDATCRVSLGVAVPGAAAAVAAHAAVASVAVTGFSFLGLAALEEANVECTAAALPCVMRVLAFLNGVERVVRTALGLLKTLAGWPQARAPLMTTLPALVDIMTACGGHASLIKDVLLVLRHLSVPLENRDALWAMLPHILSAMDLLRHDCAALRHGVALLHNLHLVREDMCGKHPTILPAMASMLEMHSGDAALVMNVFRFLGALSGAGVHGIVRTVLAQALAAMEVHKQTQDVAVAGLQLLEKLTFWSYNRSAMTVALPTAAVLLQTHVAVTDAAASGVCIMRRMSESFEDRVPVMQALPALLSVLDTHFQHYHVFAAVQTVLCQLVTDPASKVPMMAAVPGVLRAVSQPGMASSNTLYFLVSLAAERENGEGLMAALPVVLALTSRVDLMRRGIAFVNLLCANLSLRERMAPPAVPALGLLFRIDTELPTFAIHELLVSLKDLLPFAEDDGVELVAAAAAGADPRWHTMDWEPFSEALAVQMSLVHARAQRWSPMRQVWCGVVAQAVALRQERLQSARDEAAKRHRVV